MSEGTTRSFSALSLTSVDGRRSPMNLLLAIDLQTSAGVFPQRTPTKYVIFVLNQAAILLRSTVGFLYNAVSDNSRGRAGMGPTATASARAGAEYSEARVPVPSLLESIHAEPLEQAAT